MYIDIPNDEHGLFHYKQLLKILTIRQTQLVTTCLFIESFQQPLPKVDGPKTITIKH